MGFSRKLLFNMRHFRFESPFGILLADFLDPNTDSDTKVSLVDQPSSVGEARNAWRAYCCHEGHLVGMDEYSPDAPAGPEAARGFI
jgi:hypothetical protein